MVGRLVEVARMVLALIDSASRISLYAMANWFICFCVKCLSVRNRLVALFQMSLGVKQRYFFIIVAPYV